MVKGIDISCFQPNIDWNKVKNAGIGFAMLRSSYGWFNKDSSFETHRRNCEANGIPYGMYHYSYARNLNEAKIEADNFIALAKTCNPTYPLCIDMEDADGYKAKNGVSNETCVQICEYFCKRVEEAGYYAIIYANLDWLNNRINDSRLDRFDKWVAQWSNACQYGKSYGMWQYTDKGYVDGIGNIDCNYSYVDYPAIIAQMNGGKKPEPQPQPQPQPVPQEQTTTYTIQPGDTLSSIANKFGTTYQHLAEINGISNPNLIYAGQTIKVTGTQNQETTYTVQPGDTLSGIGTKFGKDYHEIASKNGISNPNLIYAGQVLKI